MAIVSTAKEESGLVKYVVPSGILTGDKMSTTNKRVMIVGDIHANWGALNTLINKRKPEIILSCGDFGYWPNEPGFDLERIKTQGAQIYFCDGNHEHHDLLDQLEGNEILPGVFYMKRGSVMDFGDFPYLGKTLFMGGADSVDKHMREEGRDWFPQELINIADMDRAYEAIEKIGGIDTVISHTCPEEFEMKGNPMWGDKINDPSRKALSHILEDHRPRRWYFGHWHHNTTGKYVPLSGGWFCQWQALNYLPLSGSWIWY